MQTGRIIRGVGGFYYVSATDGSVYECRARGIFRRKGLKPLVGDQVGFVPVSDVEDCGSIEEILPRKNVLYRPEVSNVDQVIIVFSFTDPEPSYNLLDRFLLELGSKDLNAVICFNKCDIASESDIEEVKRIYAGAGVPLLPISVKKGNGLDRLEGYLRGKTSVLAGPSGVGKSSLLNRLHSSEVMETGELSRKIKRGKNTTRHAELFAIDSLSGEESGAYVCDTPGFTSFELRDIDAEDLKFYYPEFEAHAEKCRFRACSHTHEPGCAVRQAKDEGMIPEIRYDNYKTIYELLKGKDHGGT